jgi:hypothetical protein
MSSVDTGQSMHEQYVTQIEERCGHYAGLIADQESKIVEIQDEVKINRARLEELQKSLEIYKTISVSLPAKEQGISATHEPPPRLVQRSDVAEARSEPTLSMATRDPIQMLRPQFAGKSMGQIILSILGETNAPMEPQDVAKAAYSTDTEEEFIRARNSISVALRTGAGRKGWRKLGRGLFELENAQEQQRGLFEVS